MKITICEPRQDCITVYPDPFYIEVCYNEVEVYVDILQWFPHENDKKGMVHVKLFWLYLSKNPLTCLRGSVQFRHKPGCTITEDG